MWVFWLIATGIFLLIEIATVGFLIFWLAIGALFAMITSFITYYNSNICICNFFCNINSTYQTIC